MRAHNVEYMVIPNGEIKETTGLDDSVYCQKNYDKAWGHLYRAGYDAYDCIAIGLIDKIEKVSNSASHQALHAVIPDAASVVANPYKAAKHLFTSAKVQKDVESRDQEKKQFEIYEQATKQLYDIQTLLDNHEAQMIAFDNEAQGNIKKQRRFVIIVATISGVVSLIIGYLIRKFIG